MNRQHEVVRVTKLHILPEISALIVLYIGSDISEFIDHGREWFQENKHKYTFYNNTIRCQVNATKRLTIFTIYFMPKNIVTGNKIMLFIRDNFSIAILDGAANINTLSQEKIESLIYGRNLITDNTERRQMSRFIYDFVQIVDMYKSTHV